MAKKETAKEAPKEEKAAIKKEAAKKEKKAEPKHEAKAEEKHAHAEHKPEAKAEEKQVHAPGHEKKEEKPAEAHAPAVEKKAKKARKKSKVVLAKGKRKEAVARASVSPGKGRFVFNRVLFDAIPNRFIKEIVREPLSFMGPEISSMDIKVYVRGGGQMGQAQAARTAIAKALVEFTGDEKLKNAYLEYDRALLVDDVRRVEPKKYKGPKARARFQKSYR
ncbi:30S ribosomal protein S9 [uncultured archaeon]|nr:30S ribosomal protein S9 [uncultured archaeon]